MYTITFTVSPCTPPACRRNSNYLPTPLRVYQHTNFAFKVAFLNNKFFAALGAPQMDKVLCACIASAPPHVSLVQFWRFFLNEKPVEHFLDFCFFQTCLHWFNQMRQRKKQAKLRQHLLKVWLRHRCLVGHELYLPLDKKN